MAINKNLRYDDFTASVRPDPKSSGQLALLCGYIGKSNMEGHVRVYLDEELNNFVEVPEGDILHCIPHEKSEDPLGGSRLWVKQSTVVTFGDPALANRPKSSFLEGDLMSSYANMGMEAYAFEPNLTRNPSRGCLFGQKDKYTRTRCYISTLRTACKCAVDNYLTTVLRPASLLSHTCYHTNCCSYNCPTQPGFTTCNIDCDFRIKSPSGLATCDFCAPPGEHTVTNPGTLAYGAGYAGAFNPYQTGNYGY